MRKNGPPLWLCTAVLMLSLLWRMIGAPVTAEQFANLSIPIGQARILLPSRTVRILSLWLGNAQAEEAAEEKAQLNVYIARENRMEPMTLEGYVCGVLAAEMPVQYHLEALKAQAVAARTRALWQMEHGGCSLHPGADICTDSSHCQGYATLAECQQKWQENFEPYRDRIMEAQKATQGQVITYDGELITVLYHAISGGATENAENVFSQSLPYLISIESTGEEGAKGFRQDQFLSYQEMAEKLNTTAADVQRSFSIGGYTPSGRVKSVYIAGNEMSASAFRSLMGLRSTWFSISSNAEGITFHQRGYGHGVGMSQAGANAMGAGGANYENILLHYYPGVTLESMETHESPSIRTGYVRRDGNAAEQPIQEQPAQAVYSI